MIPKIQGKSKSLSPKPGATAIYSVNELKAGSFRQAAQRLRHRIFVEELHWVKTSRSGLEYDAYDDNSKHLGLFCNREIIGYMRVTPRPQAFMLEKEFASLLPAGSSIESGPGTAEISRLCVEDKHRAQKIRWQGREVLPGEILYHSLRGWCRAAQVALIYFATTPVIARLLRMKGFPCVGLADPDSLLGAVACRIDWREYADVRCGGERLRTL